MKSKNLLISLFVVLICFFIVTISIADTMRSDGIAGYTGSPGDGNNCTSCHSATPVSVNDWISSDIPGQEYVPGETYTFTAIATHTGASTLGFTLTCESEDETHAGNIIVTDVANTQLVGSSLEYLTNTELGITPESDSNTWAFEWTAPAEGTGNVSFYGAFLAGDGGSSSGDETYLTSLTLTEKPPIVNEVPVFTSTPVLSANVDSLYIYNITASDTEDSIPVFAATNIPAWLNLADNGDGTAILSGTPTSIVIGENPVTLTASDKESTVEQKFTIIVSGENPPLEFVSTPPKSIKVGEYYYYDIEVSDHESSEIFIFFSHIPSWLALEEIEPGRTKLSGSPSTENIGDNTVILNADDGNSIGIQEFIITVKSANNPPFFTSVPVISGLENIEYIYNITTSDFDGDSVDITATTLPSWLLLVDNDDGSAVLSGTPLNENTGENEIVIKARDKENVASQFFILNVSNVNKAPEFTSVPLIIANNRQEYTYYINAFDSDNDDLSISCSPLPIWLSFTDNGNGTAVLSGTPGRWIVGAYAVELTLSDGIEFLVQSFEIVVDDTNILPYFTSTTITQATEDTQYEYNITAVDDDGDVMQFSATLPEWLKIINDEGKGSALLTGLPPGETDEIIPIILKVSDGEEFVEQSFSITIVSTEDIPEFLSEPLELAYEDIEYIYNIATFDADGDTLVINAASLPSWLTFTDNGDGTAVLKGTPLKYHAGLHSVSIELSDGNINISQNFIIEVKTVNDAPIISSTDILFAEVTIAYQNILIAEDEEDDPVEFIAISIPSWMSLTDNKDGSALLDGTPLIGDEGTVNVFISVDDGSSKTGHYYELTIFEKQYSPVFTSTPLTEITEGDEYNYTITCLDENDDQLIIIAENIPSWMSFSDNGDGTAQLSGTPAHENAGNNSVSISVSDGQFSSEQTFVIVVAEIIPSFEFTSSPKTNAFVDILYYYKLSSHDDLGKSLNFHSNTLLAWLYLIDNNDGTAYLTGIPSSLDIGEYNIVIILSDGNLSLEQEFTLTVSVQTGNINGNYLNEFNIFPNPCQDILNLSFSNNISGHLEISVMNIEGRIMYIEKIENSAETFIKNINLSNIKEGIYSISVKHNNIVIYQEKFIKIQ